MSLLNSDDSIELIVNLCILTIVLISSIFVLWKVKFEHKGYKLVFITYILFWIPIMLIRDYRHQFQNSMDKTLQWLPMMLYGAIGIFARPIFDFFGILFKSRKLVILISLALQVATIMPVIFVQSQATSNLQSIGIGIGASIIGTYELLFKEQYGKSKTLMTVSVLAFPPILADFITGPIQSFAVTYSKIGNVYDIDKLLILWVIAVAIIPLCFICALFIKEDKRHIPLEIKDKNLIQVKSTKEILLFILILIIGMIITFVKFSNSGSVGREQLRLLFSLNGIKISGSMDGYLSTVFTFGQISGTLLFTYLIYKNKSKNKIFLIGLIIWMVYHIVSLFVYNPYFFFGIHLFNGMAYGLLYNIILGYVLSLSFKTKWLSPMGIYQSILSIGITVASWFTSWIKNTALKVSTLQGLQKSTFIIDGTIIVVLIIMAFLYWLNYYYRDYFKCIIIDYKVKKQI